jgi:Glyoxalase-like domain
MATSFQVVFDCADPDRLATFWAAALHYKLQDPPEGYASWQEFLAALNIPQEEWNAASAIVDPDGVSPRIYFQRVAERKTVKNRVHLDVNAGGGRSVTEAERWGRVNAEVERLIGLGAARLRVGEAHGERWVVMQDPEGSEFCVQ